MTTTLQDEIDKQNTSLNALVSQVSQGKDAQNQIPQVQGYIDALKAALTKSSAGDNAQTSVTQTETAAQSFQSSTLYTGAQSSLTTMLGTAGVSPTQLEQVVAQKLIAPLDPTKSYSDYLTAFTSASSAVDQQRQAVAVAQNDLAAKKNALDLAVPAPAAIATMAQTWFSEAQTDVTASAAITNAGDLGSKWWFMNKADSLFDQLVTNFSTNIQTPLDTTKTALTQASNDYAQAIDTLATAQNDLKTALATLTQATQDLQTAEAQVLTNLAQYVKTHANQNNP